MLAAVGVGGVALANRDTSPTGARWLEPSAGPASSGPDSSGTPPRTESAEAPGTITMTATGDIMMSNAPSRMPPNDGADFFAGVKEALASDLVMGNLEQPLTADVGSSKCGAASTNCFAFRSPASYAKHLKEGGFDLVNTANNHARDFGVAGARNTRTALADAGVKATGNTGEITVVEVGGIKVAVVGFSSYAGANDLNDLDGAATVVEQAQSQADLVVVQVHMGAEGAGMQHVKPGTETFHGENRGNPIAFAHAVVDAGADLVVGHGPHVLRGMEFYQGKLIAYSLGNFAGGGRTLSRGGVLKQGGVLRVTLKADGGWSGGTFHGTRMNSLGLPVAEASDGESRRLVATLSADDFTGTAARVADDGTLSPPA